MKIITILLRKNVLPLIRQFRHMLLYGIIGLSALLLELTIFYVLSQKLHFGILIGNACGMLAGLLFGFTLNAHYNFQVYDRRLERLFRYGLVALGGYVLTTSLIFGFTHYADLVPFTAKLISLPPYFLFQYHSNRLFTFQTAKKYVTVPVQEEE